MAIHMSVNVGIWGAGFMGLTHGRVLRRDGRVRVAAVYDIDAHKSEQGAEELGCTSVAGEQELFDKADAVYITVPNTLHAEAALRALAAQKHIFCEKPFATSLEEARRVRDLWRSTRTVFQVGHNRRFAPVYRGVKRLLEEERFRPTLAQFKMNRGELESPRWVSDTRLTGGYLYETPLHLLDLLRWFFGEVAQLQAVGIQRVYSELDNFALLLTTDSGVPVTFVSCAHSTWSFPYERIEIYGRYFTVETQETEQLLITTGIKDPARLEDFHALSFEEKMGYQGIDSNFISAIVGEEAPAVTPEDGYRAVELVDRCYRSAGR